MNEHWIDDCYVAAREWNWRSPKSISKEDYLDMLGLFETNWMTFTFENQTHRVYYGYPMTEKT